MTGHNHSLRQSERIEEIRARYPGFRFFPSEVVMTEPTLRNREETPTVDTTTAAPDQQRGIYGKYRVERIGGTPGKHDECWYYVLDLKHDKCALPALRAYVEACREEFPRLASDLTAILDYEEASKRS